MISIDWITGVITVPKAYTTLVQLNPTEIRDLDNNQFRKDLRDLEDDLDGRPWPRTHDHNADVSVGGITLADVFIILEPYTVTFEDGQWSVYLKGTNNNILERNNKNQVSVNPGNSAGLISSPDIEFASFNGGVTIDVINGYPGTLFPIGTERKKSDNTADTLLIAEYRGFNTIYVVGDISLNSGTDFNEMIFIGESPTKTHINILDNADVINCEFYEAEISGILDGGNVLNDCLTGDLTYVNGYIKNCILGDATMVLGGGGIAHFLDCKSGVVGTGTTIIDCGGSGQGLGIRGFNGGIKITNKNGTDKISIDLSSGQCILTSTVTNGTIVCRGIGKLIDEAGDPIATGSWNGVTIINELVNTRGITDAILSEQLSGHKTVGSCGAALNDISYTEKFIYIDTTNPVNGDGKSGSPFNDISDAVDFAELQGWKKLMFLSDATLDRTMKNFTIEGIGLPIINLNGQDVDKTEFMKVKLMGDQVGSITAREIVLLDGMTGINGIYKEFGLAGNIALANNSSTTFASFSALFLATPSAYTIDAGVSNTHVILNARKISGALIIKNINTATKFATFEFSGGKLIADSSNTDGVIGVAGLPKTAFTDQTNGSALITDGMFPGLEVSKMLENKITRSGDILTFYNDDDVSIWRQVDLANGGRVII